MLITLKSTQVEKMKEVHGFFEVIPQESKCSLLLKYGGSGYLRQLYHRLEKQLGKAFLF